MYIHDIYLLSDTEESKHRMKNILQFFCYSYLRESIFVSTLINDFQCRDCIFLLDNLSLGSMYFCLCFLHEGSTKFFNNFNVNFKEINCMSNECLYSFSLDVYDNSIHEIFFHLNAS